MFMFQTLKFIPANIIGIAGDVFGILAFGIAGLVFLVLPLIDRRTARGERSPAITVIGLGAIGYIVLLTVLGYVMSPTR